MEKTAGTVLCGAGAAGVVVGSIGPWASVSTGFGTISVNGTRGDGTLTLILGIGFGVLAVLAASPEAKRRLTIWITIVAGATAALALYDLQNVSRAVGSSSSSFASSSVGWGLYLCAAGAVVGFVGGILRHGELKPPTASS